jgi:DNA-binding beta-propeller fold protein YncE
MCRFALLAVPLLLAACTSKTEGVAVLGNGSHGMEELTVEVLATSADGLDTPSDVSLNPLDMSQLWVTNYSDNSITILSGSDYDLVDTPSSGGANHFLVAPMSLAFSDFGNFATIHDTDDLTQGNATPADFMGPVLWDDSADYDGGHGGHLDMLHNSPLGGGIAWEEDNTYWVFDGYNESLTRYAFNDDHGYGGADHSDGQIVRYAEGEVARIEGVPSHMQLDHDTGLLYAADTLNGRISVLDIATGERGGGIGPNYDGAEMFEMEGATISTLADGGALMSALDDRGREMTDITDMVQPAGLHMDGDTLFISDHETSRILAFNLEGELMDWLQMDVDAGHLGGLTLDEAGNIVIVDMVTNELLRISAQ